MTIATALIIKNARIVAETGCYERAWLRAENGVIAAIAPGDAPELPGSHIIDAKARRSCPASSMSIPMAAAASM